MKFIKVQTIKSDLTLKSNEYDYKTIQMFHFSVEIHSNWSCLFPSQSDYNFLFVSCSCRRIKIDLKKIQTNKLFFVLESDFSLQLYSG